MNATKDLYWPYFEELCKDIAGVSTVKLSDGDRMERLIADSVSEPAMYPCIFSMRPKYRPIDNGAENYYAQFQVVFYVFCQSDAHDEASKDAAFDQAETLALAVLASMRQDHREVASVDFDYVSAELEPVSMMTIDSTQGYEVKCRLSLLANELFGRQS